MRLTVSQNLARLPDRATNTFCGDAPLGDTSLTAVASSPALWHFEQPSVDPENGARPTDMKEGLWAESEGSGWRKAESRAVGGLADRIRCVGAVSRRVGDKGGISRRGTLSMKDDDRQPHDPSFYRPCGAGGGEDPKRCVVTRIGCSGWAPASTRPSHDGRKRLHFTSDQMVPSCRIILL